ncbi:MAG: prepilin peptidase [Halobacteriaceae archaeon]
MPGILDIIRLLAIPIFGAAAWRDYRTRRVPNHYWYPLAVLGILLILWEGWQKYILSTQFGKVYLFHVFLSIGILIPLSYFFWKMGGFGGADAKALMVIAVLFPTYPRYMFEGIFVPLVQAPIGIFSITILTNTALLGLLYPLLLGIQNSVRGNISIYMFVGKPVHWSTVPNEHGRLLFGPDNDFTSQGLDIDALRMYLRWRGVSLAELRENEQLREPSTLPETPNPPTDGAIRTDGGQSVRDPWGAATFLDDIDHNAYGTTPSQLRDGLDKLTSNTTVWISPGIPTLVPMLGGLITGIIYGDILYGLLHIL